MRLRQFWPAALLALAAILPASAAMAQSSPIVVRLAVPDFMQQIFTDDVLAGFTAQNPGVTVEVVPDMAAIAQPEDDLDDALKSVQDYVSVADVVWADQRTVTPEATRAGLFLDLAPLTGGDSSLNADDFYPAVWQSFQWDNGVWAIPVSASVAVLTYDPAAFDNAGIAYPSDQWTMDDLANAARALTQRNPDGSVEVPGLAVLPGNLSVLLRSLLPTGYYDADTLPSQPKLATPELQALVETWATLAKDGDASTVTGDHYDEIPMRIDGAISFGMKMPNAPERKAALLPGGHAGIEAQGFAVSGGTQHPEQAYALARYLSQNAQSAGNFFGVTPARVSLTTPASSAPVSITSKSGGDEMTFSAARIVTPEDQAVVQQALAAGQPASEARFGGYLENAIRDVVQNDTDVQLALQTAESAAIANLRAADAMKATVVINVATPAPTPNFAEGQIALKFGLMSNMMPLPNRDGWNQLIADFTASDPEVKQIIFDTTPRGPDGMAKNTDCFAMPYNAAPDLDLSTVLNLDPFLDADASFDRGDVLGNTLAQLQRDNKTWALPLDIQPQMLRYDPDQFAQAGVPAPNGSWTIDQFVDALHALKQMTGDKAPFDPRDFGGTNALILIADYGGLPIDYRTDPPTINFTDPTTVDAIRQVLDLAKDGLIEFRDPRPQGGGGMTIVISVDDGPTPIYGELFGGFSVKRTVGGSEPKSVMIGYPSGSPYTPISYDVGTGFISAGAQNPDACYRWLSAIAQHPELFGGLPARRSLAGRPSVANAIGADSAALTGVLDAAMQSPNTLVFPTPFSGGEAGDFQLRYWLNRAFADYVFDDADLESELADAQAYTLAYQECVAQLPPIDPQAQDKQAYMQAIQDCVKTADPSAQ